MDTRKIFEMALGINQPWFIADVNFDAAGKKLTITIDFKRGSVFHFESDDKKICGDFKVYDTVLKEWRHLNFFEHECYLKARVPRILDDDGRIHTVNPDWVGFINGFTLLFEALVLQLVKAMPVHQVSKIVKASDHKIWRIIDKYVELTRELNDYHDLTTLGMDETSKSKGHDYVTLFVDFSKKRTVFVAEGKDANTVKSFKTDFEAHNGNPQNIKNVSCDMSPAFIKGINEQLPEAQITFDKFHILKIINAAVDTVRRNEAAQNPLLKGARYLFLKNDSNLTKGQRIAKQKLLLPKLNLKSAKALMIRESFQQIYHAETHDHFVALLKQWYFWATHCRLEPIKAAAKTIKNHWDGIVSWKKSQINNGILEGLNSLVQAAKAKARGYKTFKHLKNIIYLITGKLEFEKINPNYLPTQNL